MIAHLRGKLLAKHPNQAIVEAAGVGYDVTISVPTFSDLPAPGSEVALHIHTHVREDALTLYGFLRPSEKVLFEKLLTVSGIGPKLAITLLSGMAADEMVGAIRGNDVARLTCIPGIGKKTAERMVLELRDKLPQAAPTTITSAPPVSVAGSCSACMPACPTGAIDNWRIVQQAFSLDDQFSWSELPKRIRRASSFAWCASTQRRAISPQSIASKRTHSTSNSSPRAICGSPASR